MGRTRQNVSNRPVWVINSCHLKLIECSVSRNNRMILWSFFDTAQIISDMSEEEEENDDDDDEENRRRRKMRKKMKREII